MSGLNGNVNANGSGDGGASAGDAGARCHWWLESLSITLVSFISRSVGQIVSCEGLCTSRECSTALA